MAFPLFKSTIGLVAYVAWTQKCRHRHWHDMAWHSDTPEI